MDTKISEIDNELPCGRDHKVSPPGQVRFQNGFIPAAETAGYSPVENKITHLGITGQDGFIGSFLSDYIDITGIKVLRIVPFDDDFFLDNEKLNKFVAKCDVIIHLAAMSRGDDEIVYQTNMGLTKQLIKSLDETNSGANLIFSSSIHEQYQSGFGRAKKESRILLENWAEENGVNFAGLIIPHVFGPFAKPFHNSALATFCYQIANDLETKIEKDSELKLIYVRHLVDQIIDIIVFNKWQSKILIKPDKLIIVSKLLEKLKRLHSQIIEKKAAPDLNDGFDMNLFNTLQSYIMQKNSPGLNNSVSFRRSFIKRSLHKPVIAE